MAEERSIETFESVSFSVLSFPAVVAELFVINHQAPKIRTAAPTPITIQLFVLSVSMLGSVVRMERESTYPLASGNKSAPTAFHTSATGIAPSRRITNSGLLASTTVEG